MFGLVINDEENNKLPSKAHFGGYDKTIVEQAKTKLDPFFKGDKTKVLDKTEDGIFWLNVHSDDHWGVHGYGGKVGDKEITVSGHEVTFDSGSSLVWIPQVPYNQIMDKIKEDHTCEYRDEAA